MTEKHPNIKRPIKTVPKDGTHILLWVFDNEYHEDEECYLENNIVLGKWIEGDWLLHVTQYWLRPGERFVPTHWLPMIEGPK